MAGSRAQLTIDVTASTASAVSDLGKAETAVKSYGDAAATATTGSRDVAGAIDGVGSTAGAATAGLSDLGGAMAEMDGTIGKLGTALQTGAIAFEAIDGAATLYGVAQAILTPAVAGFTTVLNAMKLAILSNPIFIIAAIIIAIGAAFILAYQHCDTFKRIVDGAVRAVWDTIQTVYNWVKDNWPLLLTILTGPFGLMVATIIKHRDSIWDAIKAVYNWIRDTWKKITDFLSDPFEAAWDIIDRVAGWISDAIDDIVGWIKKIKFPSPPKWLTDLNPFSLVPGGGGGGSVFAAPGVARTGPAGRSGSHGGVVVNVNVNPLSGNPYILGRQIARTVNRATFIDGPITGKI